jgi:two-component system sensor histidine kinase/response regulator
MNEKINILIVEDSPTQAMQLEHFLQKQNYQVFVAKNGMEALDYIHNNHKPNLILSDINMPEMDGFELCHKIKNDKKLKDIPIILLTTLSDPYNIIKGLESGANNFIIKPYDEESLICRIQYNLLNNTLRTNSTTEMGLNLSLGDQRHFINSNQMQILELLLSTYEEVIQQNHKLVKIQHELQQEIAKRKEMENMKNEFISILNHELRGPLTAILNALSLIVDGDVGELPKPSARMIEIAHRNSERMLRLINDMLDIQKIEAGKMEFHLQPLELMPLAEQAIEVNNSYAEKFGVKIALKGNLPDVKVNVDSDRLMQVFTNLLSNAIKFSPSGAIVEVSISNNNNLIHVSITDHGLGIPTEFRERIFQKFAQANSPNTYKGGSGLGLNITKLLIEKMDGKIGFETETDVGTTFYFDLPEIREKHIPSVSTSREELIVNKS